jgi:hypothetical protein
MLFSGFEIARPVEARLSIVAKWANQPKWAADHASDVPERHALLGDAMIPGACGTLHGLQEGHGLFAPALWPGWKPASPSQGEEEGAYANRLEPVAD